MLFKSDELKTIALEKISSNIMIADNSFNITYINGALRDFFKEKDADIKKLFPSYSLDKLVGQNIDIFLKDTIPQKQITDDMSEPLKTMIKIGESDFDLIIAPIKGKSGKKLGVIVEWKDADLRLKFSDYKSQVKAVHEAQAVIRFDPNGNILEFNDNFLQTVGYQKSELIGQHHRLFVDKKYANSTEYKKFWEQLGSGVFQSGQYGRIKKNGDKLWLQATYNPLYDDNGKVQSVIKFASDITEETERRERTSAVQKTIADDLKGIAQSVSVANERAQNSSSASQQATSNVQSVSDGIEELAASVQEINRQVTDASRISNDAVTQAQTTNEIVSKMSDAAQEIANVVNLISDIAEQTNLLALNATIEAARAGEAGRGFSVVASEVKELASQTSKATDEIGSRIINVQNTSVEAVDALKEITEIINNISTISTSISGAVEEQSVTMNEMSSNMQVASSGVQTMDKAIQDIAGSITTIDETTQKVREASAALT